MLVVVIGYFHTTAKIADVMQSIFVNTVQCSAMYTFFCNIMHTSMHVYFRVEVTEFPSQSFQNRRSFLSQIFVSLATASRWHTEQLYVVIMMVVKIIREKYEKLKQTDMRILKRNTGEVAVQLLRMAVVRMVMVVTMTIVKPLRHCQW